MIANAPLPDAASWNWVDSLAPRLLRPWLKLGRFDRPTGIWLLMLPGWQGNAMGMAAQGQFPSLRVLAFFLVGAALMRAAGCAYNDIVDRHIDAQVARTAGRPIPSGQISVPQAWAFILACCAASLFVLLQMNPLTILLGVASLVLVVIYPFMKRVTWWPQAWLGLTFNWGILMGAAAVDGLWTPSWLLYGAAIFWTLGYDTIYAVQDLEDDALAGVKSSARRLGKHTVLGVGVFYGVSFILALAAGRSAGLDLGFTVVGLYGVLLGWQVMNLKTNDPARALRLFKLNALAGLILFIALVAGTPR